MNGKIAILEAGKEERPLYVLRTPEALSDEARNSISHDWQDKMGPNAPKLIVLDRGMELEVVGKKPVRVKEDLNTGPWSINEYRERMGLGEKRDIARDILTCPVDKLSDVMTGYLAVDEMSMPFKDAIVAVSGPHPLTFEDKWGDWLNVACAAIWLGAVAFWIIRWLP